MLQQQDYSLDKNSATTLYYIHDPMCSWCWGFHPVLKQLEENLPKHISIRYILGGLAADSESPMPEAMQQFLQKTWHTIQQQIPGTEFNFDFWTNCKPRRSTYPSCRAVIATKLQNPALEKNMIHAIQTAYYLMASNPSDDSTLIELADDLGLDIEKFKADLNSDTTKKNLGNEIGLSQQLGAQGFPSLVLEHNQKKWLLQTDYNDEKNILKQITELLSRSEKYF